MLAQTVEAMWGVAVGKRAAGVWDELRDRANLTDHIQR
jgi:hypothetical protein